MRDRKAVVRECKILGTVADRLAAYEDTGLSPEDIETLQRENKQLKTVLKQARAELHKFYDNRFEGDKLYIFAGRTELRDAIQAIDELEEG